MIEMTKKEYAALVFLLPMAFLILGLAISMFVPQPKHRGWVGLALACLFTAGAAVYVRTVGA